MVETEILIQKVLGKNFKYSYLYSPAKYLQHLCTSYSQHDDFRAILVLKLILVLVFILF